MGLDQIVAEQIRDLIPAPPWADPAAWRGVNRSISSAIEGWGTALAGTRPPAGYLSHLLGKAAGGLDDLCLSTCVYCADPCCLRAKIWFDQWDLIFLHLVDRPLPPGQPIRSIRGESCRYLGHRGCRLDRLSRPWICTWYLCPAQTRRLRRSDDAGGLLLRTIDEMKTARREMRETFLAVVGRERVDRWVRGNFPVQPSDRV